MMLATQLKLLKEKRGLTNQQLADLSGVLGMLWLLATVHPDLYTKAECADYAASFYKTFYGFDMDKSIITG